MKYGEYVRTKDGQIVKLENNEEFYEDSVDVGIGIMPVVDGIWIDKEYFDYIEKNEIVNHSKNIIDLIQTGDVVKYELVEHIEINDVKKYKDPRSGKEYLGLRGYNLKQVEILEILTKEQLQQNSYKVVE